MIPVVAWTVATLGIAYGMFRELTTKGLLVEILAITIGCILMGKIP